MVKRNPIKKVDCFHYSGFEDLYKDLPLSITQFIKLEDLPEVIVELSPFLYDNHVKKDVLTKLLQILVFRFFSQEHLSPIIVYWNYINGRDKVETINKLTSYVLSNTLKIQCLNFEHANYFKSESMNFIKLGKIAETTNVLLSLIYRGLLLFKSETYEDRGAAFFRFLLEEYEEPYSNALRNFMKIVFENSTAITENYLLLKKKDYFYGFLGTIILFSYFINKRDLVFNFKPRERNSWEECSEVVNFVDKLGAYCSWEDPECVQECIEDALPSIAINAIKNEISIKYKNENNENYKYSIPGDFKEARAKYYSKETTIQESSSTFHVSNTAEIEPIEVHVKPELIYTKATEVNVEPVVREVPKNKSIFTFNLFGYKFSLNKEIQKPIENEFEEFMEF